MRNVLDDGAELRTRLESLQSGLLDDVARVSALAAVRRRRAELDRLLEDLGRQIGRAQRAAVITLVGATGAGKSTLLNALAGSRIAEEGIDRPTTRRPVIYAPADADVDELLGEAVTRPAGFDSQGAPIVVRHAASGPWAGQILVDAPDVNSIDEQHRAAVLALAERSDVLVVVLHHQSVVEEASVSFVDAFAGRRRLLFVLNRSDELTAEARRAVLAQVGELAAGRWRAPHAPVVALSARAARSEPGAEGWAEFCRALLDLVQEGAIGSVKRLNAVGTAAHIRGIFAAVREETGGDLASLPAEVADGFEALAARSADEVTARLALRRADLRALLVAEAARRWDGPGGWALRAGGLTSLGLAAGAVLASRSPLVAAGTAAGALAADQAGRALRAGRVADAAALMPSPAEFGDWYDEALSPARVRAARLTGQAEGLGVPGVEAARSEAAAGVVDAWERLLDRDLPLAAERSVLRFFRLVLDLPVYALGAWVVGQAARGFVTGQYVGVDFLLNALLLLAAYLLAVRLAVAGGLGWRAGRLLAQVIARARQTLGTGAERAAQAVRRESEDRAARLTRLSRLDEAWRDQLTSPMRKEGRD